MARVLRGDLFWADLEPTRGREQAGKRPVVVLSSEAFNERTQTVIAMAVTSQPQRVGFPLTHQLLSGGLPKLSWVKIAHVRTLSLQRLGRRIGAVSPEEMFRVVEGLNELVSG
jgi:mRNA interferase MazF